MADISIGVNPNLAQRLGSALFGYREYLGRLTFDLIKQEAALTARQFLKYTPPIPYGGGDSDTRAGKIQGELSVEKDIRSFLIPRDSNLAASVDETYGSLDSFKKWKSKRLRGNVGYIISKIYADNNIERAYRKARNFMARRPINGHFLSGSGLKVTHDTIRKKYKGRIRRNRGPGSAVKSNPYYAEPLEIDAYIKKRQQMVGMINAGWWSAIQKIGTVRVRGLDVRPASKGIPEWIKKHNVQGYVTSMRSGTGVNYDSIHVVNPIGDINGIGSDANTKARAITFRMRAIAARPYDKIIKRSIDDFNAGKTNFQ